jgi:hypothetical protein
MALPGRDPCMAAGQHGSDSGWSKRLIGRSVVTMWGMDARQADHRLQAASVGGYLPSPSKIAKFGFVIFVYVGAQSNFSEGRIELAD